MRLLAASLFLSAAFDWPVPWVDRAGVAALGLFCLTLATGVASAKGGHARPSLNGQTLADASDALAPPEDALEAWAARY